MQVLEIALEVLLVIPPGQTIYARRGVFLSSKSASSSRSTLMWWRSEVNLSFFLCLALCRMRSSACDTVPRLCVRPMLCWLAFPLVSALGSTGSAADRSALFVGFPATMAESDSPRQPLT